jgi:hypothetical protein
MTHLHPTPARLAVVFVLAATVLAAATPQSPAPPKATQASAGSSAQTLDAILKELATWDSGLESAAVWKLRDYVYARKDEAAARSECETKLVAFLKTPATPMARMTAARYLRVIASDSAIPALQALMADDRTSDPALYVLQKLAGPAADKALVQLLATTTAAAKASVIAALGERRSAGSVQALVPLLKNPAFAGPAGTALGAIGTAEANGALAAALPAAAGELKTTIAAAMMRGAQQALASKDAPGALKLYDAVFADAALPAPLHRAAAVGRISASGSGAQAALLAFLGGTDAGLQQVAVMKIKDVFPPDAIGQICTAVARVPDATKVQLLATLSEYPRASVLPTVMEAAKSDSLPVRLAAMKALETVGDESALPVLVQAAAKTRGAEQAAARSALGLLQGTGVDAKLMALLSQNPSEDVEGEVLLAVGDRRIYVAKPMVSTRLGSASNRVRTQALRTLRAIGTPSDIPAVLDIVVKAAEGAEQAEAEATVGSLARKIVNANNRSNFLRMRLMTEKDPAAKVRLLGVLPRIGDDNSLPLLRTALNDGNAEVYDAAVRAFAAWPTSAARDDVFRLARESRNETHRLLAIQGLIRSITLDKNRDPVAAVADLRSAAALSSRPEEQRLVLGALAQFPCREALDVANGFLREPSVKTEAEAAIGEITKRLK